MDVLHYKPIHLVIRLVLELVLRQCSTQAGTQTGTQTGTQASTQAGTQAGIQAGTQAGAQAGTQAGTQAGCNIVQCCTCEPLLKTICNLYIRPIMCALWDISLNVCFLYRNDLATIDKKIIKSI